MSLSCWVLTGPPNHKAGHTAHLEQVLKAQASWAGPEGPEWVGGSDAQGPYTCSLASSFLTHLYGLIGSSLWLMLTEKEQIQAWFVDLRDMLEHPKADSSLSTIGPLWGPVVKGSPLVGQNFKECIYLFIFLRRRVGLNYGSTLIHRQWLMVWLDGQCCGLNVCVCLRSNTTRKLVTRRYVDRSFWMVTEHEDLPVQQRAISVEKDLNNQMDRIPCSVDIS